MQLPNFLNALSVLFIVFVLSSANSALAQQNDNNEDPTSDINSEELKAITETEVSPTNLLAQRTERERDANRNLYSLSQLKQNYLLPFSYATDPNVVSFSSPDGDRFDNFEAKYQISIRTPLWLHDDDVSGVHFGFTAVSYWQIYNDETSKPFRETNYEPEVFYQFNTDLKLMGYQFNLFRIGLNHMSNGQDGLKSRSWNRIIATALVSDNNTAYYVSTWYRLPEDDKESELDPLGDDNPDINDYYGRVELGFGYKLAGFNLFTRIRNNLSFDDNRGGITIDATYPLNDRYEFLIQYFNGYGDSLIDYNRHQQRISAGVQLRFL